VGVLTLVTRPRRCDMLILDWSVGVFWLSGVPTSVLPETCDWLPSATLRQFKSARPVRVGAVPLRDHFGGRVPPAPTDPGAMDGSQSMAEGRLKPVRPDQCDSPHPA
jgi:hypothetical protein